MVSELLQATSLLAVILSALAAVFSGMCAFLSYRLTRNIQNELKSDERIIAGTPVHPSLKEHTHSLAVVQCTLFNKSKRKTYVDSVFAFDRRGNGIPATWAGEIDAFGNPRNAGELLGIVDSSSIFLRRDDGGEIDFARIQISHSFSDSPMTVVYDPVAAFVASFRKQDDDPHGE